MLGVIYVKISSFGDGHYLHLPDSYKKWLLTPNYMHHNRKIIRAYSEIILRIQNSERASSRIAP